jgi:hypothetical protein
MKGAQMRYLKPVCDLTILDSQMDRKQTEKRNSTGRSETRHKNSLDHQQRMDKNRREKLAVQKQPKGQRDLRRPRRRWKDQENFEI